MASSRFGLLCLGAFIFSGTQAFGVLQSRGIVTSSFAPARSLASPTRGRSAPGHRRSLSMEGVNPREDADFEMTVDWDEELRKLNASQYGKRQERDLTKDMNDPEAVKWARKNAKIAQSAMENSTKQVQGAMRKAPRWQTLSRDYRFWLGLVVALSLVSSVISASGRSHDLVVWNDVLGSEPFGEALFAHAALLAATTAHSAGDAATQLAETGAAMVFA
ncbi:unnamed protein product [Ectocarpus sp. 8 AP-2014]